MDMKVSNEIIERELYVLSKPESLKITFTGAEGYLEMHKQDFKEFVRLLNEYCEKKGSDGEK